MLCHGCVDGAIDQVLACALSVITLLENYEHFPSCAHDVWVMLVMTHNQDLGSRTWLFSDIKHMFPYAMLATDMLQFVCSPAPHSVAKIEESVIKLPPEMYKLRTISHRPLSQASSPGLAPHSFVATRIFSLGKPIFQDSLINFKGCEGLQ